MRVKAVKSTPRVLVFDIEASALTADFGVILCVGFKEMGNGRTKVLSVLDYDTKDPIKAEKLLLKDVSKRLLDSDVWVAHFGRWYDTVFINTRLLYHGLPILPTNFPLVDTWKVVKNYLKLRNNRLVTVQDFLHLENSKNAILPEQWIRALAGDRKSIRYIIEHCRRDVEVLAEVFDKLKPFIDTLPSFRLFGGKVACRNCGSTRIQYRGYHLTKVRRYHRFQCQDCGRWDHERRHVPVQGLSAA